MITTIIFDLGEVYLRGSIGIEKKLAKILNVKESKIARSIYGSKRQWSSGKSDFQLLLKGKITESQFLEKIIEKNSWSITIKRFKLLFRENFTEIKNARKIIEALKNKGYKLGLLSDHVKEWINYCQSKFRYHKLFHSRQYSFEIAACKPEKIVFIKMLKKLKEEPSSCLFIDDNVKNLKTAERLGIKVIKFDSAKGLANNLRKLGINL